jgi:hypothetical protein
MDKVNSGRKFSLAVHDRLTLKSGHLKLEVGRPMRLWHFISF